jgi:hypothetical protein
MSDWFAPGHHPPTVAKNAKPTEPLWTLYKGSGTVDCRLLSHAEWGWETKVFRDGAF